MRRKCLEILILKIFRILVIIIDLAFAIFHYCEKDESSILRIVSIIKFASTAVCNTMDILWTYIYCCDIRNIKLQDPDYIEVSYEIRKQMLFILKVLRKLREEENKVNNQNSKMKSNMEAIRGYFEEMKEIMNITNNINNN